MRFCVVFMQFYHACHAYRTPIWADWVCAHAQIKVQHVSDLLVLIDQSASSLSIYANLNSKIVQSLANFLKIYMVKHCLQHYVTSELIKHNLNHAWRMFDFCKN